MFPNEPVTVSSQLSDTDTSAVPPTPRIEGYEILGLLGEGPLGLVWRAIKSDTTRQVALKLVSTDVFADDAAWVHFERDADVAARLDHPNIPRVFENAWRDQVFCLATELVEGVPLGQYAIQHRLSAREVLCLMGKIGDAVQCAHERGLIHGRLKPTNILITPDGEPHVLDFGLTKLCPARDAAELTESGETDGALACLAPEQVAGETEYTDSRTDVYSLGAVLFRLLTGQWPPPAGHAPVSIGIDADPELVALLGKAIARDPSRRYASAGELARDIRRYLAGEPLRAVKPTAGYWIRKALALYRIPVVIVAGLLVWLVAYGGLNLLTLITERNQSVALANRLEERLGRTTAILRRSRSTPLTSTVTTGAPTHATATTITVIVPPSETELYARLLQAARQHLTDNAPDQADAVLWEAPLASRNADWAALLNVCHPDLRTLRPAGDTVSAVAFAPDNKRLAICGPDSVAIWSADPLEEKLELRVAARAVVFSPDGRRLATTGADNTTRLWDAATGRGLLTIKQAAHAFAFTTDSAQLLLATTLPAELIAIDPVTGRETRAALGNTPITTAAFAADGRRLITGHDTQVQVWDAARAQLLWTFRAPAKVVAVTLSPDGQRAAVAGNDGRVFFWETVQGREQPAIRDAGAPYTALVFAPDGRTLLGAGAGRPAKLWEQPSGRELQVFADGFAVAAFAPGARRILAGNRDGAVRLWATAPLPDLRVTDFGICRDDFLKLKEARYQQWLRTQR
jgi:outer membrane protein assembly factor BamB